MNLRIAKQSKIKYIQFEKLKHNMVLVPKSKQNTAIAFDTHSRSFI